MMPPEIVHAHTTIGDGNPATSTWIATALQAELGSDENQHQIAITDTARLAQSLHEAMSQVTTLGHLYTSRSDAVRGSFAGKTLGMLMSLELLGKIPDSRDRKPFLVETQEFPLELFATFPELADAFFSHIYLPIPDVAAKASAVATLQRLGKDRVTPLVWNRHTFAELTRAGLTPLLTTVPIAPLQTDEIALSSQYTPRYIVIKESGSGAPKALVQATKALLDNSLPLLHITPKRATWEVRGVQHHYTRGTHEEIYRDIARASMVVTYPSEMVGVIMQLYARGWQGHVAFWEPRGAHEANNLAYFTARGLPYTLITTDGPVAYNADQSIIPAALQAELGTTPVARAILQDIRARSLK